MCRITMFPFYLFFNEITMFPFELIKDDTFRDLLPVSFKFIHSISFIKIIIIIMDLQFLTCFMEWNLLLIKTTLTKSENTILQ